MLTGRGLLLRTVPVLREFTETAHQFERPYLVDSTRTQAQLGVAATPWRTALAETIVSLGGHLAMPAAA